MRRLSALFALMTVPALAAPLAGPRGELRLTPQEIGQLGHRDGGAGTSGVPGIRAVVLAGDPSRPGPYSIQLRVPAGTSIASHTHRDDRTAVVISGTWFFGYGSVARSAATKALATGSFYTEPAGVAHFAMTRAQPAVLIISGNGPIDTRFVEVGRKR